MGDSRLREVFGRVLGLGVAVMATPVAAADGNVMANGILARILAFDREVARSTGALADPSMMNISRRMLSLLARRGLQLVVTSVIVFILAWGAGTCMAVESESSNRFPREILESECFNLPYGVDEATFRACIVESARTFLPPFDPAHPENFGREYDPEKYLVCMANSPIHFRRFPSSGSGKSFQQIQVRDHHECKKYRRLRPQEPEVWPGSDRPEFPALPDGRVYNPPQPDLNDKDLHLRSMAYFRLLCGAEAKEVILRTAEDVPGVYFIRPNVAVNAREWLEPHLLEHLQGIGSVLSSLAPFRPPTAPDEFRNIEDWYGKKMGSLSVSLQALLTPSRKWPSRRAPYVKGESLPQYRADEFSFLPAYEYVEFPRWDVPPGDALPYTRARRNPKLNLVMEKEVAERLKPKWINTTPILYLAAHPRARYGVTWRGFEASPGDRELGIYGNEYLIVDFERNEVMAYMRNFIFSGQPAGRYWVRNGGWLDGAGYCPRGPVEGAFLERVLKPTNTFKVGSGLP